MKLADYISLIVFAVILIYWFCSLLRNKIYKIKHPIVPGSIWYFAHGENPFKANNYTVKIKRYQEGWVNYEMLPRGSFFNDEIMKEGEFRHCYKQKI